MLPWSRVLIPLVLAAGATAQLTHVIPNGMANTVGAGSNYFPFGTGTFFSGVRMQSCYDSGNFTGAGIIAPIVITRLRWRANESVLSWGGGTYSNVTVSLATAAVDNNDVRATWDANTGPDLAVCYAGAVTVQAGATTGAIGPYPVDITLTTPFYYDPSAGDLCIETSFPPGSYSGSNVPQVDIDTRQLGLASRVFASPQGPAVSGTNTNHGPVVELTYQPVAPATAMATWYGGGCGEHCASFYESFPAGTFDLANRGFTLIPAGGGYIVVNGAGTWFSPSSALTLGDNAVSGPHSLGFQMPSPAGVIAAIHICSNGFVWTAPNPSAECCNIGATVLLARAARYCPLWTDLSPNLGGAVYFDLDPANQAAVVTFVAVPENGTSNANTFQIAFHASGLVECRYQSCAIGNHVTVVGFSPGGAARDPGPRDLSTGVQFATAPDAAPMQLAAGARPVVGTSVTLIASRIPPNSPLGGFLGGTTRHRPGLDLGSLGMPGCSQYTSIEATTFFTPFGSSATFTLPIPNAPGLAGAELHLQAATMTFGANPLGALSSNGITLRIGLQ